MLNLTVFLASLRRLFSRVCPCSFAKTVWRPNLYAANANNQRFLRIEMNFWQAFGGGILVAAMPNAGLAGEAHLSASRELGLRGIERTPPAACAVPWPTSRN